MYKETLDFKIFSDYLFPRYSQSHLDFVEKWRVYIFSWVLLCELVAATYLVFPRLATTSYILFMFSYFGFYFITAYVDICSKLVQEFYVLYYILNCLTLGVWVLIYFVHSGILSPAFYFIEGLSILLHVSFVFLEAIPHHILSPMGRVCLLSGMMMMCIGGLYQLVFQFPDFSVVLTFFGKDFDLSGIIWSNFTTIMILVGKMIASTLLAPTSITLITSRVNFRPSYEQRQQ